jgi:hypothetical protein
MWIFCQNLLDCDFSFGGSMNAQPNNAKSSPSKQADSFEVFRKSFPKLVKLISSKIGLDIEAGILSIFLVDLDGFILMVLALTGVGPFLYAL